MKKIIYAIAGMSKKACTVLIIVISILFLTGLGMILVSLLHVTNGLENPSWAYPTLISGFVLFFIVVFIIGCTTLASNYVRKNPDKDPNKKE